MVVISGKTWAPGGGAVFFICRKVKTCEQSRRHIIFMKFGHILEEFKNGSGLLKKTWPPGGHLLFILHETWLEHYCVSLISWAAKNRSSQVSDFGPLFI